ncbi:50S ribosomal protein L35 [candidate division WWE3 bacterium CG10_big_fil_rev_8_21_14_0_10_32_10]|uniref:50S ribosomal protein L35 n=1 Tax=candidate division WWE3 bacterium CG10_big_fil_rev_8_21_14_0_10_32_10 TaxID=1975090 RepID=A0A2H0RBS4_UNCKA|nr:MAG: 50S ribosomal protein L35 [candidate division WWE3 bacterium CG10_big_fil_rev_8_21_14_0_10_32_10]
MKQRTHKGAKKRIRITKKGKMLKGSVNNSHLYRKQRSSVKHKKSRTDEVKAGYVQRMKALIN